MPWASLPRVVAVTALVLANFHSTARAADEVATPVGKVIDLLKSLAKGVEEEGKKEAATYEKFSCFCKDFTASKSKEIKEGTTKIDELSSSIEAKSAEKKEKEETVSERTLKQETMSAELDEEKARCLKEEKVYDEKALDLTKASTGIADALKSLATAKKGSSLLDLHSSVRESLNLAEALNMVQPQGRRAVTAFLQAPAGEYEFHSSNIVEVLKMLKVNYGKKKDQVDADWKNTDKACKQTKVALTTDLKNNKDAITKLSEKAEGLGKDIAKAKEDLVSEQTGLQDAETYLKDLTLRCEARAKDWDQRTSTRSDEAAALAKALSILEGKVKGADEAANKRSLLSTGIRQAKPAVAVAAPITVLTSTEISSNDADSTEIATELTALEGDSAADEAKPGVDLPSDDKADDVTSWLHGGAASFLQEARVVSLDKRRSEQVVAFVQQEGRRLGSASLKSLALRAASDPFGKVKGLIQQLLERLLDESANEATKKGFCDKELATAAQARDYNMEEANKLSAEVGVLKVRKETLDSEADHLKDRMAELRKQFDEAKKLRAQEAQDNSEALSKGQEGLEAVTEAYNILKDFYKQASSAALVQASPVDEDAPGAPSGDYNGNQGAAKSILGLLQVIMSDFERNLRKTSAEEDQGKADFEKMKQNFEADVAGQTTKRQLSIQDSKTTAATIKRKMKDTKFAMDVVDQNLKTLEELKPTCQESGRMSFKERTDKRKAEMEALKKAMCKLDTEGVESDCS